MANTVKVTFNILSVARASLAIEAVLEKIERMKDHDDPRLPQAVTLLNEMATDEPIPDPPAGDGQQDWVNKPPEPERRVSPEMGTGEPDEQPEEDPDNEAHAPDDEPPEGDDQDDEPPETEAEVQDAGDEDENEQQTGENPDEPPKTFVCATCQKEKPFEEECGGEYVDFVCMGCHKAHLAQVGEGHNDQTDEQPPAEAEPEFERTDPPRIPACPVCGGETRVKFVGQSAKAWIFRCGHKKNKKKCNNEFILEKPVAEKPTEEPPPEEPPPNASGQAANLIERNEAVHDECGELMDCVGIDSEDTNCQRWFCSRCGQDVRLPRWVAAAGQGGGE